MEEAAALTLAFGTAENAQITIAPVFLELTHRQNIYFLTPKAFIASDIKLKSAVILNGIQIHSYFIDTDIFMREPAGPFLLQELQMLVYVPIIGCDTKSCHMRGNTTHHFGAVVNKICVVVLLGGQ